MKDRNPQRGIRVLVVDDEADFVETVTKRFKRRGIHCHGALTAMEGISSVVESEFDVVVLDVRLPDMSGLEALRTIKRCRPGLRVILLTGHASASAGREGLEAGASEYLLKPVDFETLMGKISSGAGPELAVRGSP